MNYSSLSMRQKFRLASDSATSAEVLEMLASDEEQGEPESFDESYALKRLVAGNPNTPTQLLRSLAKDHQIEVRWAIASNSSAPEDIILNFSQIENMMCYVATNKSCPVELLGDFARSRNNHLMAAVAQNPNCPTSILNELAKRRNMTIRASIARNPATPVAILTKCAKDASLMVSMALARNPNTPLEILEKLAAHRDSSVRYALASNPVCPVNLREIAIAIPPCDYPPAIGLDDLMRPVMVIRKLIDKARIDFPTHPFLDQDGINDIDFCCPAWRLKLLKIPTEFADRTKGMLEGPFFTSIKHPWPKVGDKKYASPVVQLDLREISCLRNQNYGDGLLQLFLIEDDLLTREIPREDVNINLLTNIPSTEEVDFSGCITQKYWLGDGCFVSQIVGYEEPVLSAFVDASDEMLESDAPDILNNIFSMMADLTKNSNGIYMFGTFMPIQYHHREIGCELIMALDSESCYMWGDYGNAQIFVDRSISGSLIYNASWSCY